MTSKTQKGIAAFFAPKKPAGAGPQARPAGATARPAQRGEPAPTSAPETPAQAEDAAPATKRAREPHGVQPASREDCVQNGKRARGEPRGEVVDVATSGDGAAAPAHVAAPTRLPSAGAAGATGAAEGGRDAMRQALARRKFGMRKERLVVGADDSSFAKPKPGAKYTPLEQQVRARRDCAEWRGGMKGEDGGGTHLRGQGKA